MILVGRYYIIINNDFILIQLKIERQISEVRIKQRTMTKLKQTLSGLLALAMLAGMTTIIPITAEDFSFALIWVMDMK